MKKHITIVLALILSLSLFTGCGTAAVTTTTSSTSTTAAAATTTPAKSDSLDKSNPVKIGITAPLSGDRSLEGEYAKKAIDIVVPEINAAGGVLGRELVVEVQDSQGNDIGAVNAYLKWASDPDIVAIIGPDSSNDDIAIADSAARSKILTTVQGSSPTLQKICEEHEWMFQLRPVDSTMCAALMAYAMDELGHKKFTFIHGTETASADQAKLFKNAVLARGGEVINDISFTAGMKDFTAQLTQAMADDSDALVLCGAITEAAILCQQIYAMGIEKPVFGNNTFGDTVTVELAGKEAMEGVYSATPWVPDTPNKIGNDYAKQYQEKYNELCAKAPAQIRDHIYTICEAIKTAGSTDRTAVRDAMLKITDFKGAITTYDCSLRGNCGRGGLVVQIKDGVLMVIQEVTEG